MKLYFECETCKNQISVIDLYRDRSDWAEFLCKDCYLADGKDAANFYLEEALYEVGLHIFSKQEIADGKTATMEDLERVIKLKAFL